MEENIEVKALKIGLIGIGPVGKSAICYLFADIDFFNNFQVNNIYNFQKIIKLKNNKDIKITLWDTSGQERFISIAFTSLKSAHGIIIVFDVTSKRSFNNIGYLLNEVKDNFVDPFIILFGNKADLPKDKWEVTSEEINEFAKANGLSCFETSARTKMGIMEGISYCANEIYDKINNRYKKNIIIDEKDTKKQKSKSDCVKGKHKK